MFNPNEPHEVQNIGGMVVPIYRQDGKVYLSHTLKEIDDPCIDFTGVILPRSQRPYSTILMAELAMKAKSLTKKTHEIVRYQGGYGICQLKSQS